MSDAPGSPEDPQPPPGGTPQPGFGREKPPHPAQPPPLRDPWDITTPWEPPASSGPQLSWDPEPAPAIGTPDLPPPPPAPPSTPAPEPGAPVEPPAGGSVAVAPVVPPPAPPPVLPRTAAAPASPSDPYPMWFDVTYPDRLSRLSTLFRGMLLVPLFIFAYIVGVLGQGALSSGWIAVFLKKKYPVWLFDSATGYLAWTARFTAYATLLTDRFPSFDSAGSPVALEYERPADGSLSRWQVFFWKGLLLIPHLILLSFLWSALFVVVVIAWFAILIAGNYPRGLFGFVTGILRWYYRVMGYFASFTDRFPPFALSAEAGAASRASHVISAILGPIIGIGYGAAIVAVIALANQAEVVEADYDGLVAGLPAPRIDYRDYNDIPVVSVTLERAYDPAQDIVSIIPGRGESLIAFELTYDNRDSESYRVERDAASLRFLEGGDEGRVGVELILVDGRATTRVIGEDDLVTIIVAFVIPEDAEPTEFRFDPGALASIQYQFD